MSDDAGQVPAGGVTPPVVNEDSDEHEAEEETFDADRAKALIAKLRLEAKTAKKELSAAGKRLKEREDADLSETERLRREIEAMKLQRQKDAEERQALRDEAAIYDAAVAQQAVKPKLIIRLIDRAALEHDDDGAPTNAEALVKALLKEEPYLKGEAKADGVPGTPRPAGTQSLADRVKEAQGKLQQTGQYGRL